MNLREVEVVDAKGELHRIDRVVISEEVLEVIDFKVGRQEEDHPAQVALYKGLVKDMFRRPVLGYLLYIDEPSLVAVP
jgi:ATP-dependent exoDNAse (exonuclease V) beta subunit